VTTNASAPEPRPSLPRRLARKLCWLAFQLFGSFAWSPPPFARWLGLRARATRRAVSIWRGSHPGAFLASVCCLAALGTLTPLAWWWYVTRPRPLTVSVELETPGPTPLRKDAVIPPLELRFGSSAARLEDVGKSVDRVRLEPALPGSWTWSDDRVLRFQPTRDWAVGQDYAVRLDRSLFPAHVLLERYDYAFHSADFQVQIKEIRFYQDPEQPRQKQVVATLRFSHPVDPAELEPRIEMELTGDPDVLPGGKPKKFRVDVSYDEFMGEAYLHSERLPIPPDDATMVLRLAAGVRSSRGGPRSADELEASTRVPGMFSYFKIESPKLRFVPNERGEPEQVLVVETSVGVLESELQRRLRAFVLPLDRPAEPGRRAQADVTWRDPTQVSSSVLAASSPIELTPVPTEQAYSKLHAFKYAAEPGRSLYLRIEAGLTSYGGYELAKPFGAIERIPEFKQELRILHEGGLLSLSGEHTLSVLSRDVEAIRISIGQVRPGQLNHIVAQSSGSFTNPYFRGGLSGASFAEYTREVRSLADVGRGVAQYSSYDFGPLMTGENKGRGLFFFEAQAWDPKLERATGVRDQRLILVTDLGVVVKREASGDSEIFVQSLASGEPVAAARVSLLGRNGIPLVEAQTDSSGRARIPHLEPDPGDPREEARPVAYLVEKQSDLAFLPFERRDRELDFSRFAIGGIRTSARDELRAYLFSERGIYRPGDSIHIGMIVRSTAWTKDMADTPIEVVVTDPRRQIVGRHRVALAPDGFVEIEQATSATSRTGSYGFTAHLVEDDELRQVLGSTSVRVEEFLPDRMRISARLESKRGSSGAAGPRNGHSENADAENADSKNGDSGNRDLENRDSEARETKVKGWLAADDVRARIELMNLFGTPAADRRISASLLLSPQGPSFPDYRDFRFFDPARAETGASELLPGATSDAEGRAVLDLDLSRYADATYRLSLYAEGFEAEGGRSVAATASVLVSPREFFLGVRSASKLAFLDKNSEHESEWIAVGRNAQTRDVGELHLDLVERKVVSVLTRQRDGTYRYESRTKESPIQSKPFAIAAAGTRVPLPTGRVGDFAFVVRDSRDLELNRIEWSVVGPGNLTRDLERSGELEIKLSGQDFEPGEEIELQIKAPYTGAGLITIERDRVYAHKWFKSDTTSTTQSIRVPEELEGNGYVVVTFVRSLDSPEIFMNPLGRAAAPFSISRERLEIAPEIRVPSLARPGEPFEIEYSLARPGRMVVFAVDEGILQVARYADPAPLDFFFQKRALEVSTLQILDLLLPEASLVRQATSASGGDMAAGLLGRNLNPFKRKGQKPAVFWSGILEASPEKRVLRYTPPDSFNGSLRILAVAVTDDAVGVSRRKTEVRGHFVLSPNVPTFVAPGDTFTVSTSVANQAEGSGPNAEITIELEAGEGLELLDGDTRSLVIPEDREASVRFQLRALERLGPVALRFEASLAERRSRLATDLSIRPAAPFRTSVSVGTLSVGTLSDAKARVELARRLYPEFRTQRAAASNLPVSLADGLRAYLEAYPYGCTEQLLSRSFPYLALLGQPELASDAADVDRAVRDMQSILRARQNTDGSFGLWADSGGGPAWLSVYATHFLTEAADRGQPVDAALLTRALSFLERLAAEKLRTLPELRAQAYAIYVLTRNDRVTTSWLAALRERLEQRFAESWPRDLTAAYVAASYALLLQTDEANRLIARVPLVDAVESDYGQYYDSLSRNAQVLALVSRHFPERALQFGAERLLELSEPIRLARYNTISSAYSILGLAEYAALRAQAGDFEVAIREILADGAERALTTVGTSFARADVSGEARAVELSSSAAPPVFYQVVQSGFDAEAPKAPITNGLEVQREYRNLDGDVVDRAQLGEELEVHVKVRAIGGICSNVAIVDLLPGGFEVVRSVGLRRDEVPGHRSEYADIREDRVLLFQTVGEGVQTTVYRIKATNAGRFEIPPTFAESMYDRRVQAQGITGSITVEAAP